MSTTTADSHSADAVTIGRAAVTVISGFDPTANARVGELLAAAPRSPIVISHDITDLTDDLVRRVITRGDTVLEQETVTLDHGCLSCTIRLDILPSLVKAARHNPDRDLIVVLPSTIEPQSLTSAVEHCDVDGTPVTETVRLDSVVTVVSPNRFLPDLTSDDDLSHRGLAAAANDTRSVADVVSRQIEYADTVVVLNRSDGDSDAFAHARLSALIERLAPWARRLTMTDDPLTGDVAARLQHTDRYDPELPDVCARGLEGLPLGIHDTSDDCGFSATVFRSRRPFHPDRLHERLGPIAERTLRGRGHLWLATQPDAVVAWESAGGGMSMGWLGNWLDALPPQRWDEASPQRRVAASLEWDPYFADRSVQLAFVGRNADLASVTEILRECPLTDEELADGQEQWDTLPDPFAGCLIPEPNDAD